MKLTESNPYGLTDKQLDFCKFYIGLKGDCKFNGTESAIQAGYSKKSAYSVASENLRKPEIVNHLEFLSNQIRIKAEKTPDDAIRELESIAFSNPLSYLDVITANVKVGEDKTGKPRFEIKQTIVLKDSSQWPGAAAIQEIAQTKDGTIKIKLHNKASALDSFLKLWDQFPARKVKSEITGKDGEPIETTAPAQLVFFLPKDLPELIPPTDSPKPEPKQKEPEKPKPQQTDSQKQALELVKSLINKNKNK